jgi:hypothetical protein
MISIVMPVAYDYAYCYRSLEAVYDIADEVILGIDAKRLSWSNKPYSFDEKAFLEQIGRMDKRGIVRVIQDDFHSDPHPMQNDVRERRILSTKTKPGNWIIQIDSDEIALNAREFRAWLPKADPSADLQAKWITVFKTFGDQCLVANEPDSMTSVGTRVPAIYQCARVTGQPRQASNLILLHYSWGRSREQLEQKLTNWSHARDFDVPKFLTLWDSVTLENYRGFSNFHPLHPPLWRNLSLIKLPTRKAS